MKTAIVVILFSFSVFAQETSTVPRFHAACGPLEVNFDTEASTAQPPAQSEPSKALVYVIGYFPATTLTYFHPTIPVGLDGKWMGATHGSSYLFFSADPGEHHLCIRWQSSQGAWSRLISLARLTAEPGKTYYFRVRALGLRETASAYLDLDPIDPDEGRYLVASSRLSTSHPKK